MAGSDNLNRDSQSLRIKWHSKSRMDTSTRRALKVNAAEMRTAKIRLAERKAFLTASEYIHLFPEPKPHPYVPGLGCSL